MFKRFIFRWKLTQIDVLPSVHDTPEQVWEWAERWLVKFGHVGDPEEIERLHQAGEVVAFTMGGE